MKKKLKNCEICYSSYPKTLGKVLKNEWVLRKANIYSSEKLLLILPQAIKEYSGSKLPIKDETKLKKRTKKLVSQRFYL